MKNIFDRYYKKYDAWYEKSPSLYLSELAALKKVVPARGKGLEIGVGTGRFAVPLKIRYGIDPSKNMLKFARQRGINVRSGRGEKLPYKNSSFDHVVIIATLCFVRDPENVLKEARRILKTGGRIIIAFIDKNSILGKYYQRKKSVFYKKAVFFSVKDIRKWIHETGFTGFTCFQTLFGPLKKMGSLQTPRKGYGKGSFIVIRSHKPVRRKKRV